MDALAEEGPGTPATTFAPVPLFDAGAAPAGPDWAQPYVPKAGRHWGTWLETTMRGMMADLAPRHPGWRPIWWKDLWPDEPIRGSGARLRTWVAVTDASALPGGLLPAVWFTGWESDPPRARREYGAPCPAHALRVAAYPGLLRGSSLFTGGCAWQSWATWVLQGALARVWRIGVPWMIDRSASGAVDDLTLRVHRVTDWMRSLGWTTRARLVSGLWDPDGPGPEDDPTREGDWSDNEVWERAKGTLWQTLPDDLPWPEAVPAPAPTVTQPVRTGRTPAVAVARPLFDLDGPPHTP